MILSKCLISSIQESVAKINKRFIHYKRVLIVRVTAKLIWEVSLDRVTVASVLYKVESIADIIQLWVVQSWRIS